MIRLEKAREQFVGDWLDLRHSLQTETGKEPRWSKNLLWPVLALAAGLAVGAAVWQRRASDD